MFRHMRRNVVAYVALLLALTGTASAASSFIITSTGQIKPSVRRALKGNRGPRGFPGSRGGQGAQGTPGATGPAGIATVHDVSNTTSYCQFGGGSCAVALVTATCPSGSFVTGGGAYDDTIQTPISTFAGPTTYAAVSNNESSFTGSLTVTAVCASGSGLQASIRHNSLMRAPDAASRLAARLRAQHP
jgi:hypothetical protein